jgi:hypothetical protein
VSTPPASGDFILDPAAQLAQYAQKYGQPQSIDIARVLQQLAEAMLPDPNQLRLRQGTVSQVNSTDPPTVDVFLGDTIVPAARYMDGYIPLVGDSVWVMRNGPDSLVVGDLQASANSITAPASGFASGNWYRLASMRGGDPSGTNAAVGNPRAHGRFALADTFSGKNARTEFVAGMAFGSAASAYIQTIAATSSGGQVFTKARFTYKAANDKVYLDVWCAATPASGSVRVSMMDNDWPDGWVLDPTFGGGTATPATPALSYSTKEWLFADEGDTWTPLTLGSSWVYYGSPFEVPAYRFDTGGYVLFRGLMKNGTASGTIGAALITTMPAGLRVTNTQIMSPATASGGTARLDVFGTATAAPGGLQVVGFLGGATNAYVSLNGLTYRPDK